MLTGSTFVAFLACASLGLLLAHRLQLARRRRRAISEPALRLHVSLQRMLRNGAQGAELPESDIAALRQQMSWRQRRTWDEVFRGYRQACENGQESLDPHLSKLLALTALR